VEVVMAKSFCPYCGTGHECNPKPVDVAILKDVREITGASLIDCKKAWYATGGDKAKMVEWIRRKGEA
jgi:hypothetical protein